MWMYLGMCIRVIRCEGGIIDASSVVLATIKFTGDSTKKSFHYNTSTGKRKPLRLIVGSMVRTHAYNRTLVFMVEYKKIICSFPWVLKTALLG
jgi:hypothetical protein